MKEKSMKEYWENWDLKKNQQKVEEWSEWWKKNQWENDKISRRCESIESKKWTHSS